jgi:uncharacterized protein YndB with AHSA1/START domain
VNTSYLIVALLRSIFSAMAFAGVAHAQTNAPPMERAITHAVTIKASAAEAYKLFTTQEGVTSFFAPEAVVEPRIDGLFEMHINPFAAPGEKGGDGMRFLALQENKMLTFTWNAPPSLPEVRKQRTVVIVRFIEKSPTETEVRLHHIGWGDGGEWDKAYDYLSRAWPAILGNLKKRTETGPIDWKPWLERMRPPAKAEGGAAVAK